MTGPESNKLENLKERLYSRQQFTPDQPVQPLAKATTQAPVHWQQPEAPQPPKAGMPLLKIIVWLSVAFFVCAVGIAGYLFYTGYNTISANNVQVAVTGPNSVAGGRDLPLQVSIQNQNTIGLQNVYLVVDYPEGARKTIDSTEALTHERIPVGAIASGASITKAVQAVYFGVEGSQKKVQFSVEYQVNDSVSLFNKQKEYLFTLGMAPVSVAVGYPTEVNSGQNVTLTFDVSSNLSVPIKNVAVQLAYPFGFTFASAAPAADLDNSIWNIESLNPGERKRITVVGKLEGQENEDRAFRYTVGLISPTDRRVVATAFLNEAKQVALKKPFIGLNLTLQGDPNPTHFMTAGESVNARLDITNNITDQIGDITVKVQVTGAKVKPGSISSGEGFYQSANNTITWERRQVGSLANLNSGQSSNVQFGFGTLPYGENISRNETNQPITVAVTVTGVRRAGTNNAETISVVTTRQVQFATVAKLDGTVLHSTGPFNNIGTLPPLAEKQTSYTIVWGISNTFNALSNIRVSAILPPHAKFMAGPIPNTESVTYNQSTGEVVWTPTIINSNTGYGTNPQKQVSFQVVIVPSTTQVDSVVPLIGESTLTAVDSLTNATVTATKSILTTANVTDPNYTVNQGVVSQ